MRFDSHIKPKYRDAIEEAISVVIEKGNPGHVETAMCIRDSKVKIQFVPLKKIQCSGVTGIIDAGKTNDRIKNENIGLIDALGEVYIKFADWTFDVAGQRGCQGTIVHEGLHACDFAKLVATLSNIDTEPLGVVDPSLYDLEYRAAVASAEYLQIIGAPDFVDDGLKLGLLKLDTDGKPLVDLEGIDQRMKDGYGVTADAPGVLMTDMLGLKPKDEPSRLARLFGL